MITASHNPPSDNGFKCYARDRRPGHPARRRGDHRLRQGGLRSRDPREAVRRRGSSDGSIVLVGPRVDEAYIAAVVSESVSHARDLSIVYTPMHGVGETSVAAALETAGFEQVNILASQRTPDGDFPNVPGHVSNPEIPKTLEAAIAEAKATGADLVLASDPDADRIGVGVPVTGDPKGEWTTLDGNQIGVLLAAFVMKETEALGKLRSDHYLVTTLVSTQMARALAEREGVRTEDDLLVGFKWIAQRIDEVGPAGFLFGFEESHGYLKGTHVRDKDAAVASLLFAELAATVKDRKQTVLEYLDDLYIDVGHYGERLINKTYKGREGVDADQDADGGLPRPIRPARSAASTVTEVLRLQDPRDPRPRPARRARAPCPSPRATCSSSTPTRRAPGSPPGRRAPSRRSSSTCSPGPRSKGPGPRSPRPRPRPRGGLTGWPRTSNNTSQESLLRRDEPASSNGLRSRGGSRLGRPGSTTTGRIPRGSHVRTRSRRPPSPRPRRSGSSPPRRAST